MSDSIDTSIIQFKSKSSGGSIYPVTKREAVIDDNGEQISKFFTEYNLIQHLSGTHTLSSAISAVPQEFRYPGLKIIFLQSDRTLGYFMLNKSTWSTNTSDWVPMIKGTGYEFAGVADTSTVHQSENGKKFYIAKPGTYKNFGSSSDTYVVNDGQFGIIKYDGSYSIEYITVINIADNLTTGDSTSALSARQGQILNNKIIGIDSEIGSIKTSISNQETATNNKFSDVNVKIQTLNSSFDEHVETSNDKFTELFNRVEELDRGEVFITNNTLVFRNYADATIEGVTLKF